MTQVRIDIRKATATGTNVPLRIGMQWAPTVARNVGSSLVLPESFAVLLDYAPVTIVVAPTGPGWAWRVRYSVNSQKYDRYLVVPNSASVVEFTDLVEVDPGTLTPSALSSGSILYATDTGAPMRVSVLSNGTITAVPVGP